MYVYGDLSFGTIIFFFSLLLVGRKDDSYKMKYIKPYNMCLTCLRISKD